MLDRFRSVVRTLLLASVALYAGIAFGQGGKQEARNALVIGNGAYSEEPLPNAVGDANAVAAKLRSLGFNVFAHTNLAKDRMQAAYREFVAAMLEAGGVGVIFYAGHAMQFDGQNYLIPVDASTEDRREASFWGVPVAPMLAVLEKTGARANIFILDACRDNPFGRNRAGLSRGLASLPGAAPNHTLIEYATAPGKTASDGTGQHSPFTTALLAHLGTPEIDVAEMFRRVRADVQRDTGGAQQPWESSSLTTQFAFNAGGGAPLAAAPASRPDAPPAPARPDTPPAGATGTRPATGPVGSTVAGKQLLRYLGNDTGAARYAKIQEYLRSNMGGEPLAAEELVAAVSGLSGQQKQTAVAMLSQNVSDTLTVAGAVALLRSEGGDTTLALSSLLRGLLPKTLSVNDFVALAEGVSGSQRQSLMIALRDKLPATISLAEFNALVGSDLSRADAMMLSLDSRITSPVAAADAVTLLKAIEPARRQLLLRKLAPKLPELTVAEVLAIVGDASGTTRRSNLTLLVPLLKPGITQADADALLGDAASTANTDLTRRLQAKIMMGGSGTAVPSSPGAAPPTVAGDRLLEEKPPQGKNRLLSEAQLRWCMFEHERLEAARALLTPAVEPVQRNAFSLRADDYDARCLRPRFLAASTRQSGAKSLRTTRRCATTAGH